MKRGKTIGVFRMLLAFFAGVLVTLFLLVPGKKGPTVLVGGDRPGQEAALSDAASRIEQVSDVALFYAYKARDYVAGQGDGQEQ